MLNSLINIGVHISYIHVFIILAPKNYTCVRVLLYIHIISSGGCPSCYMVIILAGSCQKQRDISLSKIFNFSIIDVGPN